MLEEVWVIYVLRDWIIDSLMCKHQINIEAGNSGANFNYFAGQLNP